MQLRSVDVPEIPCSDGLLGRSYHLDVCDKKNRFVVGECGGECFGLLDDLWAVGDEQVDG